MNNDLFETGGYRLDTFELFNWGVFDKTIYTLNCNKESSLLTGTNGSGKTTIVDALLSLLVPPQQRYYNQSSGADKKRDRTEESYVLGAYGTKLDDESNGTKLQSLRDKNTFSVLNGIFVFPENQSELSLLQVRYFSENSLQHVYAITKQKLTIEQIDSCLAEKNMTFDKHGKWKKCLEQTFGTMFFGDSFKKYSETFSLIFGFKSDKALRLFSQIVGLKVLGNLTDFIRINMLEESDTNLQFEKLLDNYKKLMQCNNEIQKTKKQIELLEPIIENGKKYENEQNKKIQLESFLQTIPAWYAISAINFYEIQKDLYCQQKTESEQNQSNENIHLTETQKTIDNLNASIASNNTKLRLNKIENDIENATNEKTRRMTARESFFNKLQKVNFDLPETEKDFFILQNKIKDLYKIKIQEKTQKESERFELQTNCKAVARDVTIIKAELESLSKRRSNIPEKNIALREFICKNTDCKIDDIPFVGELIQVLPTEKKWSYAIEKLLHSFALTLLVKESLYKKVTDFVKNNNLNTRIVFYKVQENDFYFESSIIQNKDSDTVPGKIQIKTNTEFTQFLEDYIQNHFNFRCTDDIEIFTRADRAISSTGLMKNGIKHEKDDRKNTSSQTNFVLGWDNTEKRQALSLELDSLLQNQNDVQKKLENLENYILQNESVRQTLQSLADVTSYNAIDVVSVVTSIDALETEKKKLLENDKDLKSLEAQLETQRNLREAIQKKLDEISKAIGSIEEKLKTVENKLQENRAAIEFFENIENKIDAFCNEYKKLTNIQNIEELETNRKIIQDSLDENIKKSDNLIKNYEENIRRYMTSILRPTTEIRAKYGDWTSEFTQFEIGVEYLSDFNAFYERQKKDDLPKYQEEFHNYLHETMNADIVDFNQAIQNGETEIKNAIRDLNTSLKTIIYQQNPDTFLQLELVKNIDTRIAEFSSLLRNALPNSIDLATKNREKEEALFVNIKRFLDTVNANENNKKYVLDIRNWFTFAASENFTEDGKQKQYYPDSASLSGGEKAKLTYTILASAIAYQFGITNNTETSKSFRFAIIDEAFSKSDATNSDYAMRLFKQLDLQLMVITPMDKINIVEDYISSVHITENVGTNDSRLLHMTIEKYKENQGTL